MFYLRYYHCIEKKNQKKTNQNVEMSEKTKRLL